MDPAESIAMPGEPRAVSRRRGRIVVVMLVVLIVVGVVPLATMSWKLIGENRETLATEEQRYQLLLATAVAGELDLHVESLRDRLLSVAQTLGAAVRRHGNIPSREIQPVLNDVIDERIAYLRYSFLEGASVRSVSAGESAEALEPLFEASLRRAAEDHRNPREGATPGILSDPFFLEEGNSGAILAVAAPVAASGAFRGVLTALIDLERVWKTVTVRNQRHGHLLFAMDDRGQVFATSDANQVAIRADVSDWVIVQNYMRLPKQYRSHTIPFRASPSDDDAESAQYIGTYELTGQGWGIFVQARDEDIYWIVGDMVRSTLSWTLVLFGIAALAAFLLARTLSNPINRLAEAARALAGGDFSARADVDSNNEIGELACTFNSMAEEIESYIRRLKKAFEENNELFLGMIRAMAQAIDAKDPYTRGHSVRVNRYSMLLARELGLSQSDLRDLHVSSLLHDVGKIGIDDAILKKNGRLTEGEFEIIKTHTVLGASIMAPIRQMKKIIPGLRHHHERCDGSGYPDGLTRDRIPTMARIIAVADTFDAITTVRPYQSPMTFERAVARINELRGDALDSEVVDAFNRIAERGLLQPGESDDLADRAIPPPPSPLEIEVAPLTTAATSA